MERIASSYYELFRCAGGKCPFTCCQQWMIAGDDGVCMRLGNDGRCEKLTFDGLCSIQKKYGENAIPRTCQVFPRIDKSFDWRTEHTVTACCPAVIDLMYSKDISFSGRLPVGPASDAEAQIYIIRNLIINLMMNKEYSCEDVLKMSFYILLDFRDRFVKGHGDPVIYAHKTFIDELAGTVSNVKVDAYESMLEDNETLRDIMSAYIEQGLYTEYLSDIEKTAEEISSSGTSDPADDETLRKENESFINDFSKYEHLIRNYLANEIFIDLVRNDSDPVDMLIGIQWTAICYASIKQASFIFHKNKGRLDYEDIRGIITIMSRMTGYDEQDIDEYLQDRYKSLIWEWGYFALLV